MSCTGREFTRLHAARLTVSCLWAAGRTEDAETTPLPVAVECARHGLIRFLLDGGSDVVAVLAVLRERVAENQWQRVYPDLSRTFVDAVLSIR